MANGKWVKGWFIDANGHKRWGPHWVTEPEGSKPILADATGKELTVDEPKDTRKKAKRV
jgi:hypothetical protein